MQAMKGATVALGSMNKSMNLPQLQRIAMEFERENDVMEQRQEMMDDAVDDAMDVGVEEEGDEVVEQVLEEIGIDLNQAVSAPTMKSCKCVLTRVTVARRDTDSLRESCPIRKSNCPSGWRRRRRRRSGWWRSCGR